MIALMKALPLGILLTVVVALFIGSGGSTGGFLNIFHFTVEEPDMNINFGMYWSWVLFLIGTGLAWALLLMMGD